MSFTEEIKSELCRISSRKACCKIAECLGMLLYGNRFSVNLIRLISSSREVRRLAQVLFNDALRVCLQVENGRENSLVITDHDDIWHIFDLYGFQFKTSPLSLNRAFVEEDCCKTSFLRGAFLMGGSASIAGKGYHLELSTSHYNVSNQVATLLREMELDPGIVIRRGNFVLYYKNSETIEQFLTVIGATQSAMEIMLKKVEKSVVNQVNRGVNCETANIDKVVDAASRQMRALNKIEEAGIFYDMPFPLQETARLRWENPTASLAELAQLHTPPISKSGLNSRLKKIIKISEDCHND